MKLFCDCEFNSYQGAFISIALVADDGREFYESVGCAEPEEWVAKHVMPFIDRDSITLTELQTRLGAFLEQFDEIHVVADFPVDIYWFCDLLITGPGDRLLENKRMTMEVRPEASCKKSVVPHQALADARALRDSCNELDRMQHADMLATVSD